VTVPATAIIPVTPATTIAQTADVQYNDKREESDMEALRRWLQDKRFVSLKEIGGDLSISGEVRTEAQFFNEKAKSHATGAEFIKQRGEGTPRPSLAWDVEFNLMLDYRTDRTWSAVKVEFDNDMGTRSGTVNKVRLEKAYLGGRLIAGDTFTWDAEIGRRYLFNVYDSKIEFGSIFDGALVRFGKAFDNIGDFYVNAAAFLVNDKWNHYGEVVEIGALRVANLGLNLKLSSINWFKPGLPADETSQRWRYLTTQFLASYQFFPDWIGKRLIKFYGASLFNALAQEVEQTGNRLQNVGWYAGVSIGLVKKAGDFAIDANYQWVQAQAVAEADAFGIGRGNAAGVGLYTTNDSGSGSPTTHVNAVGRNNFKGFEVDVLYAFTNNLTVEQNFKFTTTLNKNIGPNLQYKQWELEFIYAF